MNILSTILIIIDILVAILLIALVLVQQSKKGGGLGTTFGGGGSDTLFGAHASSQLSKLTAIFATVFAIVTLVLTILSGHMTKKGGSQLDELLKTKPPISAAPLLPTSMPLSKTNVNNVLPVKNNVVVSPHTVTSENKLNTVKPPETKKQ